MATCMLHDLPDACDGAALLANTPLPHNPGGCTTPPSLVFSEWLADLVAIDHSSPEAEQESRQRLQVWWAGWDGAGWDGCSAPER